MLTVESAPAGQSEDQAARPASHHLQQLVVDQIDCGLLVCDAHGQMLQANRAALRELDRGGILKLEEGTLRSCPSSSKELSEAIQAAATRGIRRLVCLGDHQPLMLVVLPLAAHTDDGSSVALVMMGRRTLCTPLGLELLAIQRRLTWAEQRVLRALIDGIAPRRIAAENGVAVSTIRTQIQAVRDKLGVDTIDSLLFTAARIPLVSSTH